MASCHLNSAMCFIKLERYDECRRAAAGWAALGEATRGRS